MQVQVFESNVNYDLGKTMVGGFSALDSFESNVNYDLGKTANMPTTTK